ncbi:DBP4 [Acrasis kona]|uniref:DBP4 n=1 Tax=Acrasis kona TaxID=1008807 RepID=A0AAW2YMK7_9EUKA
MVNSSELARDHPVNEVEDNRDQLSSHTSSSTTIDQSALCFDDEDEIYQVDDTRQEEEYLFF